MLAKNTAGRVPTEAELLEWMKIKPRTFGWDAWLAYDRSSVNLSLWRDFIERADTHPFAGTVTGKVVVQENLLWENLHAVRLGAPQLTFEQSDFNNSRVTLNARAVGGVQFTVSAAQGRPKHITCIAEYTPLQAPALVADAFIDDSDGSATAARQVRMDLLRAEDHRFSLPGTAIQQARAGELFRDHVAELPVSSQHCILNVLGNWENGTLVPEIVTTRPLPIRDAQGEPTGDGAVVVMVAAKGSEAGTHPDVEGDWKYPIPAGYHAALWIGSHCLMKRIVEAGIRGVSTEAEFHYDNADDPAQLTVTKGALQALTIDAIAAPFGALGYEIQAPLSADVPADASLDITRGDNSLTVNWKTSTFANASAPLLRSETPGGTTALDSAWRINSTYEFARADDGALGLRAVGQGTHWFKPVYRQAQVLDPQHYQHFPALSQAISTGLTRAVEDTVARMAGGNELGEVDRLRFEGLQCPGGTGLALASAHLPRDLALFGTLGARVGSFVVSPTEDCILAGGTLQFEVEPAQAGLEWRVERVEGFPGSPGSISVTGLYTAPAPAAMEGRFVIVNVTASNATHSSTAWVSVVTERLALNPLVFAVAAGSRVRLSAGCLEADELDWTLKTATGALLEELGPDDDALLDGNNRMYVAGTTPSGTFFSVDEVTVEAGGGEARTTPVLVVEKARMGTIVIRDGTGLRQGQVQLDFDGGGGEPIADAEWVVKIGEGTITQDGLYTPDPASTLPYVVITAEWNMQVVHFGDYIILPLPLVDLADAKRALV